jgi:hypothetical protein
LCLIRLSTFIFWISEILTKSINIFS